MLDPKDFEVTREDNCIWVKDNRTGNARAPLHVVPDQALVIADALDFLYLAEKPDGQRIRLPVPPEQALDIAEALREVCKDEIAALA